VRVTKLLLPLILVLALLIGTTTRSQPSQDHTEPATDTDDQKTKTDRKPTPVEVEPTSTISQPAADKKEARSDQQSEHWYDFLFQTELPNWIIIVGWAIAALIAFFSLGVVRRQADIAEAGVKVAQSAMEAAKLALDVERPYLIVDSPTLRPYVSQVTVGTADSQPFISPEVLFDLRNRGKGLAIAESMRIRLLLAAVGGKTDAVISRNRDRFQFKPDRQVISPDKHIPVRAGENCFVSPELWEKIENRPNYIQLVIVGVISYRDVYERQYRKFFCYTYWPGTRHPQAVDKIVGSGLFIAPGHAKYNRTVRSKSDTLL
jgi:hypothetical protein